MIDQPELVDYEYDPKLIPDESILVDLSGCAILIYQHEDGSTLFFDFGVSDPRSWNFIRLFAPYRVLRWGGPND